MSKAKFSIYSALSNILKTKNATFTIPISHCPKHYTVSFYLTGC